MLLILLTYPKGEQDAWQLRYNNSTAHVAAIQRDSINIYPWRRFLKTKSFEKAANLFWCTTKRRHWISSEYGSLIVKIIGSLNDILNVTFVVFRRKVTCKFLHGIKFIVNWQWSKESSNNTRLARCDDNFDDLLGYFQCMVERKKYIRIY